MNFSDIKYFLLNTVPDMAASDSKFSGKAYINAVKKVCENPNENTKSWSLGLPEITLRKERGSQNV